MAGSDLVPDPNDEQRAQVGNAQTTYESEMALFFECMPQCAQKVFDTADIVRDRDLSPTTASSALLMPHRRRRGKMTAHGKHQSAAEGLRPPGLRCQRHLHLQ